MQACQAVCPFFATILMHGIISLPDATSEKPRQFNLLVLEIICSLNYYIFF